MDTNIDSIVRLKFLEKRVVQLQNAIMQMDIDMKSIESQANNLKMLSDRAKHELSVARSDLVRVRAEEEEKKNGKI